MDDERDEDLWDFVTRDIKPISREKRLDKTKRKATLENPARIQAAEGLDRLKQSSSSERSSSKAHAGAGLDRKTAEKLRKGQIPIEARLDLHGMSQSQAHAALNEKLKRSYERGHRCILVITGKGRSPGSEGVLKRRTAEWLASAPLSAIVLRFVSAQAKDGGDGALYVLLRRKRG